MDRIEKTAYVVSRINKYRSNLISKSELLRDVCDYYDYIKEIKLTSADLTFLYYISNVVGVPQYFDLLLKEFNNESVHKKELDNLSFLASSIYESTLYTNDSSKLHSYQKEILDKFYINDDNRFFLSASTSFGKTHLVFEIIRKLNYKNVVLVFPTIALLSENIEKIITNKNYEDLKLKYKLHTLSEVQSFGDQNILIFTPERYLSFIDNIKDNKLDIDFAFIDEAYKIDNEYFLDNELKENERDVAYRLAVHYLTQNSKDILLAGPYIDMDFSNHSSMDLFLVRNRISRIDYNKYELVAKQMIPIFQKGEYKVDENLAIHITRKKDPVVQVVKSLINSEDIKENMIVYCSSKFMCERISKKLLSDSDVADQETNDYNDFIQHLKNNFPEDWIVIKSLRKGIGIHHGLVPKYIQKEIINLFNSRKLRVLISTTTITEGINTTAKNLIVIESKKGDKVLKQFDAKNIAGRAGRFLQHYSGRVISLDREFNKILDSPPEELRHKNYDKEVIKDSIDLFFTNDEFLSEVDKKKKTDIQIKQTELQLPDWLLDNYKVVSREDKIFIYESITQLSDSQLFHIRNLIKKTNIPGRFDIDYDGFQTIIDVIEPIVKNKKLKFLIVNKGNNNYSTLTHLVHYYLIGGFAESVNYKKNVQGSSTDTAIRESAEFIYNTLKYQVVKYLGVFNIMYRYDRAMKENNTFDLAKGIDRLIIKLEYNAFTFSARIANDYGVPFKILEHYEGNIDKSRLEFDEYEHKILSKIDEIIRSQYDI